MAVEAQLCPQCGGSIQFAGYQMQVICPYCGTTVDKVQPQAAGAAPAPYVPQVADLPIDELIQLSRMYFAGQRADALAFIQQNLGLDETQAAQQLDDTDLWLPGLAQLPERERTQIKQMVFDGQRAGALAFIQQNLGLDEAHASRTLDKNVVLWSDNWKSESQQKPLGSNSAVAVLLGNAAFIIIAIFAMVVLINWLNAVNLAQPANQAGHAADPALAAITSLLCISTLVGVPGIILIALSFTGILLTYSSVRRRIRVSLGKRTPATLLKVVPLKTGQIGNSPVTTTRLQVQVAPHTGAPHIVDYVFDLAPETAARLQPGGRIEVITNGPNFTYVTDPIKVVG